MSASEEDYQSSQATQTQVDVEDEDSEPEADPSVWGFLISVSTKGES
jgi:hypothetical protein